MLLGELEVDGHVSSSQILTTTVSPTLSFVRSCEEKSDERSWWETFQCLKFILMFMDR